jgi:hypothetical protein
MLYHFQTEGKCSSLFIITGVALYGQFKLSLVPDNILEGRPDMYVTLLKLMMLMKRQRINMTRFIA